MQAKKTALLFIFVTILVDVIGIGIIIKPLLSYMTLWMVSIGGNLHEPYFQVSMPIRMYTPSANLTL